MYFVACKTFISSMVFEWILVQVNDYKLDKTNITGEPVLSTQFCTFKQLNGY